MVGTMKEQQQQWTSSTGKNRTNHGVNVVFVRKQHAKIAKNRLKKAKLLDDRYRMVPADIDADIIITQSESSESTWYNDVDFINFLIAIPIKETLLSDDEDDNNNSDTTTTTIVEEIFRDNDDGEGDCEDEPSSILVGIGYQSCPYSTKMNCSMQQLHPQQLITIIPVGVANVDETNTNIRTEEGSGQTIDIDSLSLSQFVLLDISPVVSPTIRMNNNGNSNSSEIISNTTTTTTLTIDQDILDRILKLDSTICPAGGCNNSNNNTKKKKKKHQSLEIFGDDRTVVIPSTTFEGKEFLSILYEVRKRKQRKRQQQQQQQKQQLHDDGDGGGDHDADNSNNNKHDDKENIIDTDIEEKKVDSSIVYDDFWYRLALAHNSSRIVRRGGVDPNSKIRETGHRVMWSSSSYNHIDNHNLKNSSSPPSSSSSSLPSTTWITVTEQGIRQSFDLTKVMFSRGNVSEKIRFGKTLVQENEIILDMYTGIGYYTLPAIIHGKASFVYACEWNTYAVNALRYNIKDNKIENKVKILEGDCREQVGKHNLTNMVDRVSLGLLPSSEGGWRYAIKALKVPTGGWLHIHGNVPAKEMELWTTWVCHRLDVLAKEENRPDNWFILCNHVERVKSFAPTVFHYVADIFVGPKERIEMDESLSLPSCSSLSSSVNNNGGVVTTTSTNTDTTSCRAWMKRRCDQTWIPASSLNDDESTIRRPSCALSPDGVLSQDWMR
jgi:hypothetical protein